MWIVVVGVVCVDGGGIGLCIGLCEGCGGYCVDCGVRCWLVVGLIYCSVVFVLVVMLFNFSGC